MNVVFTYLYTFMKEEKRVFNFLSDEDIGNLSAIKKKKQICKIKQVSGDGENFYKILNIFH